MILRAGIRETELTEKIRFRSRAARLFTRIHFDGIENTRVFMEFTNLCDVQGENIFLDQSAISSENCEEK